MAKIITVTSGKGGVGKTSISLNLALSLAKRSFKVCLFDADLGLANVNILTGIYPEMDLESVISGHCRLDDIIIKNYDGIDIIPGSSGVEKISDLTPLQTKRIINTFLKLEAYDYFIFDTSAGISSQVISFCRASNEIVLVVTTEPTSLTDAYSMLKVLSKYKYKNRIKVVINKVSSAKNAKKVYGQLKKTANEFLSVKLEPLGMVASDSKVRTAVLSQKPFFKQFPNTAASRCISSITEKLIQKTTQDQDIPLNVFWTRCLSFFEKNQLVQKGATKNIEKNKFNVKDAFENIESVLSTLIQEVSGIKQALSNLDITSGKDISDESPAVEKSNIIDFKPPVAKWCHAHEFEYRSKPIARGRLRTPTQKELSSWNDFDNPIVGC